MSKDKNIGFDLQKPKITKHVNNNYSYRIQFKNRLNSDYVLVKEDFVEIGKVDSYKDFINKALNPILDKPSTIYGAAKRLEPLNTTINRMKATIDNANEKLSSFYEQELKQVQDNKNIVDLNNGKEVNNDQQSK